jgi:large subunit ribosomal protein L3
MSKQIKGILGTKLGMTQVFNDAGQIVPVTVVQAGPCVVTSVKTPDKDGYSAVQLGFGEIDPRKVTKPVSGVFEKAGLTPRRYLAELRTDDASEYTLGQEVTADVFASGQHVDVTGRSKGKGTAGVMKRHGFHGLGGVRTTVQSLTVHAVDAERGLLLIKGAVPGPSGRVVLVRSAARTRGTEGEVA